MKISVNVKTDHECIGILESCDRMPYKEIRTKAASLFNFWIEKNKIDQQIFNGTLEDGIDCNLLFIHESGRNIEWIEWRNGYMATVSKYYSIPILRFESNDIKNLL